MKRIFLLLATLGLTAAACADPNAPQPIRDGNSGIVLNKDLNVYPWGNFYYLLVNGPGPENIHWASVNEFDWLTCNAHPTPFYNWERGEGCD